MCMLANAVEQNDNGDECYTPGISRCPSRSLNRSIGAGGSDEDDNENDEIANPAKRTNEGETSLVARIGKRKGKQTGESQSLAVISDQEQAHMRQMEHERKMQQEAIACI